VPSDHIPGRDRREYYGVRGCYHTRPAGVHSAECVSVVPCRLSMDCGLPFAVPGSTSQKNTWRGSLVTRKIEVDHNIQDDARDAFIWHRGRFAAPRYESGTVIAGDQL
jgi:hypothetical protein